MRATAELELCPLHRFRLLQRAIRHTAYALPAASGDKAATDMQRDQLRRLVPMTAETLTEFCDATPAELAAAEKTCVRCELLTVRAETQQIVKALQSGERVVIRTKAVEQRAAHLADLCWQYETAATALVSGVDGAIDQAGPSPCPHEQLPDGREGERQAAVDGERQAEFDAEISSNVTKFTAHEQADDGRTWDGETTA